MTSQNHHKVDHSRKKEKRRRDWSSSSSSDEELKILHKKVAQLKQQVDALKRIKKVTNSRNKKCDDHNQRKKGKWRREWYCSSSSSDDEERFSRRQLADVEQKLDAPIALEKRKKVKREQSPARRTKGDKRESFDDRWNSRSPKPESDRCRNCSGVKICYHCKITGHIAKECWFRQRELGYKTPLDDMGYEPRRPNSRSKLRDW